MGMPTGMVSEKRESPAKRPLATGRLVRRTLSNSGRAEPAAPGGQRRELIGSRARWIQPHRYELHVTTERPAPVEGRHELRPVAPVPAEAAARRRALRTGPMPYLRACAASQASARPASLTVFHPPRAPRCQGMSGARKPAAARGSGGRAARMVEHGSGGPAGIGRALALRALAAPRRARPRAPRAARRGRQASRPGPARHDGSAHGRRRARGANQALAAGIVELAEADPESPRSRCATSGRTWRWSWSGSRRGTSRHRGSRSAILPGRMSSLATARLPPSVPRIAPLDTGAALDEPIGEASAHLGRAGRGHPWSSAR